MSTDNKLLGHYTQKIQHLISNSNLSEISINPDGAVWVEEAGEAHMAKTDISVSQEEIMNIGRMIAGNSDITFGEKKPIATANIPTPTGKIRIQAIIPPATTGVGAVSIRLLNTKSVTIDSYNFSNSLSILAEERDHKVLEETRSKLASNDLPFAELARIAIREKWNVIISGGTSSGKTTVLNSMLNLINTNERIVSIEEVAELNIIQPNKINLLSDRSVIDGPRQPIKLLEASLRLRPDRIICGEIRGDDANTFLELTNTGHDGSMCSMHANSPLDAIGRMTKMVRRGSPTVHKEEVIDDIQSTIHLIIQMKRVGDRREVHKVVFPPLLDLSDSNLFNFKQLVA